MFWDLEFSSAARSVRSMPAAAQAALMAASQLGRRRQLGLSQGLPSQGLSQHLQGRRQVARLLHRRELALLVGRVLLPKLHKRHFGRWVPSPLRWRPSPSTRRS